IGPAVPSLRQRVRLPLHERYLYLVLSKGTHSMRLTRLAPLLAALLTALWFAPIAFAHAHYVSSTPGSGAHLATAPSSISITYDDALDPNLTVLHVLGPNGKEVTTGKTVVTIEATKVATVPIT